MGTRLASALGVALFWCEVAAAITPQAKVFSIAGAPPMSAVSVGGLQAANAKGTKFSGAGALVLDDARRVAVAVILKVKKGKGTYTMKSTGAGFPTFKGTIVTNGDPEVVTTVSLVLKLAKKNVVKQKTPGAVS